MKRFIYALFFTVGAAALFFVFLQERIIAPSTDTPYRENVVIEGREDSIKEEPVTFVIGGDVMFDRGVDFYHRDDKIFTVMESLDSDFFNQYDLAVLNLEGPISREPIPIDNTYDNLSFNMPPKTPEALARIGIDAVSLANNHTYNQGQIGFANTKQALVEAGIVPIGRQTGVAKDSVKSFDLGTVVVSIIAVNILETGESITGLIKSEKNAGNLVIVFPHWGVEYNLVHHLSQETLAKAWIDAGADAVVGSHPHVVQDIELYKGKPIVYSLGNLVFDQTFSLDTQIGLLVAGTIKTGELTSITLLPVESIRMRPRLMSGSKKDDLINRIAGQLSGINGDTIPIKEAG